MAIDDHKIPLVSSIGDRLKEVLKSYSRINHENEFYDAEAKTLDPTKIMPVKDLRRYLEGIGTGGFSSINSFEQYFGISTTRSTRYSEYEQIVQRIPEAARALQIYTDSILSPNLGIKDNQLQYTNMADDKTANKAKKIFSSLLNKTKFEDILPQIIYTTLLYGDCFLEVDSTSGGFRYIIHSPKNCTLLHDEKTDIELGLIVQTSQTESQILKMLSMSYPNIRISLPSNSVAIISNKNVNIKNRNSHQYAMAEEQIEELLRDVLRDYEVKYRYLAPSKYIKFSIYYNNNYYPYGTSILDPVRAIAKQLLLVESALSIYRVTRTPLRSLWTVEVGNTPEDQIAGILNGVQKRVRRQHVIDADAGSTLDSIPDIMGIEEDIWTPSIGGNPILKMEHIPPPDISGFVNDADYFKKKLLGALGIPPSYLAEEEGSSTRALLTLEDVNFSRTIKKYQNDINHGLDDLVETGFSVINKVYLANTIKVSLPTPRAVEDTMRVQNLAERLNTASSFMSDFEGIPKLWVLKNIVGLTDDDIREMVEDQKAQKEYSIFGEQVWEEPEDDRSYGGYSGGGGGVPDFSGGGYSDDFGEDMDMTESDVEMASPLGAIDSASLRSVDLGNETTPETE